MALLQEQAAAVKDAEEAAKRAAMDDDESPFSQPVVAGIDDADADDDGGVA